MKTSTFFSPLQKKGKRGNWKGAGAAPYSGKRNEKSG